jgi:hypothetical protein
MSRDIHEVKNDFMTEREINSRLNEIARLFGSLQAHDPQRETLLLEIKALVRRLNEMKGLA